MRHRKRSYEGTAIARVEFDRDELPTPPETRYAPIVRFDDEDGTAWSLGMEFFGDLNGEGWVKVARVDLLADEAPHHKMVRGAEFDVFEGPIKVGTVEVKCPSSRLPEGQMHDGISREMTPLIEREFRFTPLPATEFILRSLQSTADTLIIESLETEEVYEGVADLSIGSSDDVMVYWSTEEFLNWKVGDDTDELPPPRLRLTRGDDEKLSLRVYGRSNHLRLERIRECIEETRKYFQFPLSYNKKKDEEAA